MVNAEVNVIGAGRTDAGVHARAMVANCYLETELQPDEIRDYMNRYLPDDICVDEVKLAADRFHARYRAVGKLYTYTCYVGVTKPVFNRKYVTDARLRAGCGGDAASGGNTRQANMILKASAQTRR